MSQRLGNLICNMYPIQTLHPVHLYVVARHHVSYSPIYTANNNVFHAACKWAHSQAFVTQCVFVQVASSTLDASAKIYAGRVDSIYTDAFKVLTGFGRDNQNQNEGVWQCVELRVHLLLATCG